MENYRFDIESGILFGTSTGPVTAQDMIDSLAYFAAHQELPRDLLVMEDGRLATSDFTMKELNVIGDKLKEVLPLFHSIKHAVIHSDPKNTVLAMIFNQKNSGTNYQLNVFSTLEGALSWLKEP